MTRVIKSRIVLIIVGIAVFLAGVLFFNDSEGEFAKAEAVISDIITVFETGIDSSIQHEVHVDYTIDGVDYHDIIFDTYSSSMYIGKTIDIEYDVNAPTRIRSPFSKVLPYILFAAGAAIFLWGVIPFIVAFAGGRKN